LFDVGPAGALVVLEVEPVVAFVDGGADGELAGMDPQPPAETINSANTLERKFNRIAWLLTLAEMQARVAARTSGILRTAIHETPRRSRAHAGGRSRARRSMAVLYRVARKLPSAIAVIPGAWKIIGRTSRATYGVRHRCSPPRARCAARLLRFRGPCASSNPLRALHQPVLIRCHLRLRGDRLGTGRPGEMIASRP